MLAEHFLRGHFIDNKSSQSACISWLLYHQIYMVKKIASSFAGEYPSQLSFVNVFPGWPEYYLGWCKFLLWLFKSDIWGIAFLFWCWKGHTISSWYLSLLVLQINILSVNGIRKPPSFFLLQWGYSVVQKSRLNYSKVQGKRHGALSGECHVIFPADTAGGMSYVHSIGSCSWSKWIVNEFCYLSLFCFGLSRWR